MAPFDHSTIRSCAEMELANVGRVDEEERDLVSQFFSMLGSADWRHASHADGTDVFKLPGERIHRIMGVTRTSASPEDVLHFFSEPRNFKQNFTILDSMFKDGQVIKVGGEGVDAGGDAATGQRQRGHRLGNFAALSIGGKDRSGPTDPTDLADGAIGFVSKLKRSAIGRKLEGFIRRNHGSKSGLTAATIAELPSAQTAALDATLLASSSSSSSSSSPSSGSSGGGDFSHFKDRPGHALLHGTFKLPSVIPDRDFIWDQVAMRLPTGSVLIAGRSVDESDSLCPCEKGHVRGAVLTSGYYIVPDHVSGGSTVAFVVQADPRGSLPAWVVNLVAPKQAHNVSRLRDYLDAKPAH